MTLAIEKDLSHKKINQGLQRVINSEEYIWYIGNSRDNVGKVKGRFGLMEQLFKEICND